MLVLGDRRKAFEVNVTHVYHKDKLARRGSLHGNPIGRTIMIYTEESDICACPFLKLEKTYLLAGHLDDAGELLLKRKNGLAVLARKDYRKSLKAWLKRLRKQAREKQSSTTA